MFELLLPCLLFVDGRLEDCLILLRYFKFANIFNGDDTYLKFVFLIFYWYQFLF